MRLILALLVLVSLSSCTEERVPAAPKGKKRTEVPSTIPDEPAEERQAWVPKESDIVGTWKKPCSPSPTDATKSIRQTIQFPGDHLLIETEIFSDTVCGTRAEVKNQDFIWEDGWNPIVPQLDGNFVTGWQSLFIDETDRDNRILYETHAVLVEEAGKRVLYMQWTTEKTVSLTRKFDRFEVVPE